MKFALVTLGTIMTACVGGQMGFQGGVIPQKFQGLDTAAAISPTSFELKWTAYPGVTKYRIYSGDENNPIASPGFTDYIFTPSPLDSSKTYQYSVTAIDPDSGQETGDRTNYSPVTLLPHFNFQNSGSVTALNKTSIRVNWLGNPSVTYKIYQAEQLPTGTVNYNSFVNTAATVSGVSTTTISGLLEGHTYCFVAVAAYIDNTNDSPVGVSFTGDIGAKLTTLLADGTVAASQKCVSTQSDFTVTGISVYAPKATLSNMPTFYANVNGDATEDATGPVSIAIYQVDSSNNALLVGTRTGTGKVTATTPLAIGKYKFFAVITDLVGAAHAAISKEIIVGTTGTLPANATQRQWVYVRNYGQNEYVGASPSPTPYGVYPEKQQGGFGVQHAGSAVAVGDFDCDGKMDIAIGVPDATIVGSDNRPSQSGKVVIYYDTTTGTPRAGARSQTITFDILSATGADASRNLRLGTSLVAGNFNKDNQITNQSGSIGGGQKSTYQCDDLVIGSGYGPMFVVYGARITPSTPNGLNYTNSTSFSVNPTSTCQPNNVCGVAAFIYGPSGSLQIGTAFAKGDYNGDGYEDLAATTTLSPNPMGTWVFRGTQLGLVPPTNYAGTAYDSLTGLATGTYLPFPYIPVDKADIVANGGGKSISNYGISVATLRNSYYDSVTGRVRDTLLIGSPNSVSYAASGTPLVGGGRVYACTPTTTAVAPVPTFTSDPNVNLAWDCSQFMDPPVDPLNSNARVGAGAFGTAMVGIKNALQYRPDQFTDTGACAGYAPDPTVTNQFGFANCSSTSTKTGYPGAVAISSLNQSTVYIYYAVNAPTVARTTVTPNRAAIGGAINTMTQKLFLQQRSDATPLNIVASTPCQVVTGTEYCDVQKINHPTTGTGSYGLVLGSFPGNNASKPNNGTSPKDAVLAVAAPYRTLSQNGQTYSSVGSVQLYYQNSFFSSNPVIIKSAGTGAAACSATNDLCRFSDGFSNSLTASLDYDGIISNNVNFGLGGIVGGPTEYDSTSDYYNDNTDIVVGVPGNVATQTDANNVNYTVYDNGAGFISFSHGGVYRPFRITDTSGVSPWHILDKSVSQEANIKFHQAVGLGDINSDGIDDVAVRINQGNLNRQRIYYGSNTAVGVSKTSGNYQDFAVQGDVTAGMRFVPAGKTTNGQFSTFWVTGATSSYLYFTGINGIIQGVPSAFSAGNTPRKFYSPLTSDGLGSFYLNFANTSYYNAESTSTIDTNLNTLTPFAHGDFNGDGYEDFAFSMNTTAGSFTNTLVYDGGAGGCSNASGANSGHYCGDNTSKGRVFVFYGGGASGFQTAPDSNGGYPLNNTTAMDYSANTTGGSMISPNVGPCNASTGLNCKIQMIYEPSDAQFGATLAAVPLGTCLVNGNSVPVSGLVASRFTTGNVATLMVYKPACLNTPGDLSGLKSYPGEPSLTFPAPMASSKTAGSSLAVVTNMMGSSAAITTHLIATDMTNDRIITYPVSSTITASKNFYDQGTGNWAPNGGAVIDYTSSVMLSGTGTYNLFGYGISSAGDINGDGYGDVAIGIDALPRKDISTTTAVQGGALVLFGGPTGLQYANAGVPIEPTITPICYTAPSGNTIASTCNPTLVYLPQPYDANNQTAYPQNGAYERFFISPYSRMSFGAVNENLGSLLMGTPGRDTLETNVADRILSGGAFYVLP